MYKICHIEIEDMEKAKMPLDGPMIQRSYLLHNVFPLVVTSLAHLLIKDPKTLP